MNAVLHLDWLALQMQGPFHDRHPWRFEKLPYQSRQWRALYEVYYFDDLWGTISTQSTLPTIPGDYFILKIENKYLYSDCLWDQILSFYAGTAIRVCGISRVDICIDFQRFDNGDHPSAVIRDFASGKIDCLGKMRGTIVRGQSSSSPYEYLSLGSRTSDVRVYLYNKSKELRDVKMKPWILASDYLGGLSKKEDIWRLEVSLKGQSMSWANAWTGEDCSITLDDLRNDSYLQMVAFSLFKKYFRFIKHSTAKNRYQNEEIPYITTDCYRIRKVVAREFDDANRADRIFIKKAMREALHSLELRPDDRYHVVTWLYEWACARGLESYVHKLDELAVL